MDAIKQIDCFNTHIKFCRLLAIWPTDSGKYYRYYSFFFILFFVIIYDICFTINFWFLPRELEIFAEDIILYCTIIATVSKTFTFIFHHDLILKILSILECDIFQDDSYDGKKIIASAKRYNTKFWKIIMVISVISHISHDSTPFIAHLITGVDLRLPVFSGDFIPDTIKRMFFYPLYFYETIGIHFHMWYNVNIDSLFLGLILLMIAQLDILNIKLRNIATSENDDKESEQEAIKQLNRCIIHYVEVAKFSTLLQDVFSVTLFIQFSTASIVLCVCLFRFTMPAPTGYYVYLVTYMTVMLAQRAVPCWYGTQVMEKSAHLAHSVYECNWIPRSRRFKSSKRLFVERANRPITIISGKMVVLSLNTFTSIMNSAYSFYTLLRHMQAREN